MIILPVEQYVFPAPVNVRQANPRLDMRGRGNRQKRPKKDPYASIFFLKYIQEADESTLLDNTTDTIWDASSYDGKTFRRRFGIPYKIFHSINKDWLRHGEFRKEGDALGQERTDSRILLLGCFRFLAKGITFDAVEELSNVSLAYFHVFFKKFVDWFPKCYNKDWIVFPSDNVGVRHVEARYASRALPGCVGSIDCVHLGWDMCPAGFQADCLGKEGFPTLVFEVIVSYTRRIMAVTPSFFGAWNDKTVVKFDQTVTKLRTDPFYTQYSWDVVDSQGRTSSQKGLYLICDGGYLSWQTLIPPYKHQIEGSAEGKWSKHVESLRKDVECTFGILKKRFAILKNHCRIHSKEQIEDIFRICCILHNMNHDFDGLDNVDVTARMGTLVPERHEREGGDDDDDDDDDGSTEQEQGVRRHERELFRIRRDLLIAHFQYYRGQGVDFYQNT